MYGSQYVLLAKYAPTRSMITLMDPPRCDGERPLIPTISCVLGCGVVRQINALADCARSFRSSSTEWWG